MLLSCWRVLVAQLWRTKTIACGNWLKFGSFSCLNLKNNWQDHCQSENSRGGNCLLLPHAGYAYGCPPCSLIRICNAFSIQGPADNARHAQLRSQYSAAGFSAQRVREFNSRITRVFENPAPGYTMVVVFKTSLTAKDNKNDILSSLLALGGA